jgi:hypothetical protein
MKEPSVKLTADKAIVLLVQSIQEIEEDRLGVARRSIAEAVMLLNQFAERENFASENLDSIFKDCCKITFYKWD